MAGRPVSEVTVDVFHSLLLTLRQAEHATPTCFVPSSSLLPSVVHFEICESHPETQPKRLHAIMPKR